MDVELKPTWRISLRERYIRDDISTEEYVVEVNKQWDKKKHAPLKMKGSK